MCSETGPIGRCNVWPLRMPLHSPADQLPLLCASVYTIIRVVACRGLRETIMRFAAPTGILPVSKLVNSAISVAGPATRAFAGPPAPDETYQPEILSTMTGWLTHSLTDHPKGKGKGKGGEGFVQFKWFKDFLIRKCTKEWCSCCAAKTLMDEDGACELCVRAWRLTMVCTYWRVAVVANGGTAWLTCDGPKRSGKRSLRIDCGHTEITAAQAGTIISGACSQKTPRCLRLPTTDFKAISHKCNMECQQAMTRMNGGIQMDGRKKTGKPVDGRKRTMGGRTTPSKKLLGKNHRRMVKTGSKTRGLLPSPPAAIKYQAASHSSLLKMQKTMCI